MARPVWTGSISFGLVNVPVKAYTAVRDHTVHFHQLEKDTGARIRNQKVSDEVGQGGRRRRHRAGLRDAQGPLRHRSTATSSTTCGRQSTRSDRRQRLRRPRRHRSDLLRAHLLARARRRRAPSAPTAAARRRWRTASGSASARVVMRNKQYLAAIRPLDGALAMSTMRFADEVVPTGGRSTSSPRAAASRTPKELKLATQIIDSLATDWDPEQYHDTYTDELEDDHRARTQGQGRGGRGGSPRRRRRGPRPHGGARAERRRRQAGAPPRSERRRSGHQPHGRSRRQARRRRPDRSGRPRRPRPVGRREPGSARVGGAGVDRHRRRGRQGGGRAGRRRGACHGRGGGSACVDRRDDRRQKRRRRPTCPGVGCPCRPRSRWAGTCRRGSGRRPAGRGPSRRCRCAPRRGRGSGSRRCTGRRGRSPRRCRVGSPASPSHHLLP